MNDIRDLFPGRMRERTFQLKAKRDAGAVWHEPQFVECKQCGRRAARTLWTKSLYVCPNCGYHMPMRNRLSSTAATQATPPMRPAAVTAASRSPVLFWAAESFSP